MTYLHSIWRQRKPAFLAILGWLVLYGTALAQPPKQQQSSDGGSYVVSYFLVILAIALGLLIICRPAGRRDRAKPEHYDEKGLLKDKE